MPTLKRFRITNFRGIQDAEIVIDARKKSDVVTLIGLNESGKTTILEALSHFSTGDRTISNLVGAQKTLEHLGSLIPINKRAAFTGSVSISADFEFEPGEFERYLKRLGDETDHDLSIVEPVKGFNVRHEYKFKDSAYVDVTNYWTGITFGYRPKKSRKKPLLTSGHGANKFWIAMVNAIEKQLYQILYFPTFIVDMPEKIYLQEHKKESQINIYYRNVLGDVISSLGGGLDIKKHIIDRIDNYRSEETSWLQEFLSSPDRQSVDAVFQKAQRAIHIEVIGSWEKVLNHPVKGRSVKVDWGIDPTKDYLPFVSFSVTDGYNVFAIHERSLGFRWFFSYLLFTQFRSKSGKKTLFLFDEPAANLHSRAQSQLLDSIARMVEGGNKVIYSTHSPHLINPAWLSDAVIIENKAVDIDAGDDIFLQDTEPTNIKATSYGKFVSEYPSKTTYFQPVLEKLLHETPPIVGKGPFLCVEGISDFHFLSYVRTQLQRFENLNIVPGVGAGGFSSTLPALYGNGAVFILLLDDDDQGKKEKVRDIEDGIIAESRVYTLGDVSSKFKGMRLEELMSPSKEKVKERFSGKSSKKHVAMYLAEANASSEPGALNEKTIENGNKILQWFVDRIKAGN